MTTAGEGNIAPIVRPYTRTGGRTEASLSLPLEALIATTRRGGAPERYGHPDHREIAILCREVRSVAEVAALTGVPLGVARILIADMAAMGLVTVHKHTPAPDGEPDLALLERVLSGLRRL